MRERIFNFGQTLTYVALSSLVLQAFVKIPWQPKGVLSWIGLLMTASAMYLLNTGLVAGIISISSQIPFTRIWLESLAPALLEHLVMFSFGTLTALVVVLYPWGLVLMALPSAAVFIMLDRTLRMEAQHKQLAEQNAGLATYLSQQAEQLREAYRALEETLEAKNKVLQSIFLKLRTPLETVASRSRLVRQKLEAGQVTAAAADLDLVLHNSQMTWHFVNDFVSLQVLERRQLLLEDVTVEQLFRDALEAVEEHVLSTGLDVYADYAEDLPVLRADRVRLKLMLIHLLDNAIRFSPAGGKVLLNARSAADGMVQITVTDYGQGIPKAQLPHVFDWFARVDVVVTSEAESYGLGLAIAQRVAELHGGAVQIESQPEQMTTVTVTLPSQLPGVAAGSYSA
jgi:signal transduction histidine kinase